MIDSIECLVRRSTRRATRAGSTTIERELAATDGVLRVYVNPATETAYVDYDPSEVDAWTLARAVERAGYRPGRPVEG